MIRFISIWLHVDLSCTQTDLKQMRMFFNCSDSSLLQEVSTVEDIPTIEEEDDLWMEQLCTLGKYEEDDKNEKEDDMEDDLG